MKTKVIVAGAVGRMGSRIIANICSGTEFELVGALESSNDSAIGKDAGILAGNGECGVKVSGSIEELLPKGDVLIDFTVPHITLDHLEAVARHKKAMVIGTTGHTAEQKASIEEFAKKIPFVMASNMSVGVNMMWMLISQAAKVLGEDYDIEIVEMHHRNKQDAPSGTAMTTAQVLAKAAGRDLAKDAVYHREGMVGPRKTGEIGIQTLRGGDVVGDHTVIFAGPGERLEVAHKAASRDIFAQGALRAAKWVVGKPNGLYSMADVLGFNR